MTPIGSLCGAANSGARQRGTAAADPCGLPSLSTYNGRCRVKNSALEWRLPLLASHFSPKFLRVFQRASRLLPFSCVQHRHLPGVCRSKAFIPSCDAVFVLRHPRESPPAAMAPLILHNVPDEERYVGDDGVIRPYAMVFPQ